MSYILGYPSLYSEGEIRGSCLIAGSSCFTGVDSGVFPGVGEMLRHNCHYTSTSILYATHDAWLPVQ